MALDNFTQIYETAYLPIFSKELVGKKIANFRFEPKLKYGESVTRTKLDLSNVIVRSITPGTDRTIDPIADSEELITINYNKGTTFPLTSKELIQGADRNPAAVIGKEVAKKTATTVDADILYETLSAEWDFDNGDLTTLVSDGTPITLSSTTVPQMAPRMPAKLRSKNNIDTMNQCLVVDSYGLSSISQYMQGKEVPDGFDTFTNGFQGNLVGGAKVYVSENLTGEAVLSMATNPTAADTVTINGITFTFVATLGAAGDLHICSSADATRLNMANAFNAIGTAIAEATDTGYQVISAANQLIWNALNITATDSASANTLTIVARGSGRLTVAETFTAGGDSWSKNMIHCYFGKEKAIDVVMQEMVDIELRDEAKQRTTNVFTEALYGIKTFSDGAKMFLDVLVNASA